MDRNYYTSSGSKATWETFQPKREKLKKNLKKLLFIIFREMELPSPKLKKLIFLLKKNFFYTSGNKLF